MKINGGAYEMKKSGNNLNYLSDYSMFESVKEMDEAIDKHIKINQYEMNETDRTVLMTLSRYSVKYRGVAHLKVSTIAKIVGKSTITVRRTLNKLESLHIIKKQTFMREKTGGNGANIYIILPFNDSPKTIDREEPEKPTQTSVKESEEIDEPINSIKHNTSNNILDTEKKNNAPADFIKKSLQHAIPTPISDALAPFFDGQGLYDAYGVLLRAKASIDRNIRLEEHVERYINAFYNVARLYKAGKVRKSFKGLLYATWERLSSEISRTVGGNTLLAYDPY